MKRLGMLAAVLVLLGRPAFADHEQTRAAFRHVLARLIAAASEPSTFASVTGRKTADDHSGDTRYAVTVAVPIFAGCEIRNDDRVPTQLACWTKPSPDGAAVRARFDEIVADVRAVLAERHLGGRSFEVGSCDGTAVFSNGERCLDAGIPGGSIDLAIEPDAGGRTSLRLQIGNE